MASIRTSDIMPMVNVFIEPNWCEDHAELELPVGLGSGADGVKDEDCDAVVKVGMLVSEEPPVITEPVIGMGVLMVSEADVTRFWAVDPLEVAIKEELVLEEEGVVLGVELVPEEELVPPLVIRVMTNAGLVLPESPKTGHVGAWARCGQH
jgi:hypothetical protein